MAIASTLLMCGKTMTNAATDQVPSQEKFGSRT